MNKKYYSGVGLVILGIGFLVFTLLNNLLFNSWRLDLTENSLYTLSEGSEEIVSAIDEPINLYFFFSEKSSEDLTQLRSYATRVEELLDEYALIGDGKINLSVIDPEPFSEEEDQAAEFGLQSVPINAAGDELYFGLAATNALDDMEIISFFQPDKEEFLEYEISKLVQSLSVAEKPTVGVLSSIDVQASMNQQTFQMTPAWMVIEQLEQLFNVEPLSTDIESIPVDVDILLVIHPKQLSETLLFSIDQFVMAGGKLLAFVDPLAESDRPQQASPMMPAPPTEQSSNLNRLTEAWGLTLRDNVVLGDSQAALAVDSGTGTPVRHLAIVGMESENFSSDDIVTSSLESINLATAGILDISEEPPGSIEPLITSSAYSMPLDSFQFQFMSDPQDLMRAFNPTGEQYVVAARISGSAPSAFPDGLENSEGEHLTQTQDINVILIADTDILADRLWVQVQNFFGQRIASPWANNGEMVINALDNLSGGASLISIRSRGRFTRPFDVVQDLRREAEASYQESADDLQSQLAETEQRLTELQSAQSEGNLFGLSPEQEQALVQFQQEKLIIRKQLRDVRHQLDRDIELLGSTLKFINIALIPILMTLLLLAMNVLRLRREDH
ncbi:MAG: Gldg family protein [Pseudomonadales bacterium]|nr:Gldg family protein [Pseudomonadales bacterium]